MFATTTLRMFPRLPTSQMLHPPHQRHPPTQPNTVAGKQSSGVQPCFCHLFARPKQPLFCGLSFLNPTCLLPTSFSYSFWCCPCIHGFPFLFRFLFSYPRYLYIQSAVSIPTTAAAVDLSYCIACQVFAHDAREPPLAPQSISIVGHLVGLSRSKFNYYIDLSLVHKFQTPWILGPHIKLCRADRCNGG